MSLELYQQLLLKYIEDEDRKEVIIPEGVREIGERTFYRCQALEKVTLPASLYRISNFAFQSCEKLSCIELKNYVYNTGYTSVHNCPNLKHVILHGTEIPVGLAGTRSLSAAFQMIAERTFFQVPAENKMLVWHMFQADPKDMKIMLYIGKNFDELFRILIDMHQLEIMKKFLLAGKFLIEKNIDDYIQYANQKQRYEEQILLTEYKFRTYSVPDIDEKLKL